MLPWTWLEALVAPDNLGQRVRDLVVPEPFAEDTRALDAIATARRYADGWRPESDERIDRADPEEDDGGPPIDPDIVDADQDGAGE